MARKVKNYEDEPDAQSLTIGTAYQFSAVPKENKPIEKEQIGFVRQKRRRRVRTKR